MELTLGTSENGKAFRLPVDAATQTFAFIARKGAGKTYAAGKLTEQMLDKKVQVVVLDAVGNWYGLRIAADGGAGYDIPVVGGLRGDIPLDAAGGELIADIIVDTGRSLIIDISQFSKGDRKRFCTALGERLWARKKGEHHPTPLHLVIEECQLIIPQMVGREEARMVGIFEEIVRLGRNYGIGVSMITQRPQSVNKEVLTQTECLVVLQVNGTPERKAIKEWVVQQGVDVNLVESLPSLPVGTAYIWSPQWLNLFEKVKIGQKKTIDASSTPKVGEKRVSRELKPLDLGELQNRMKSIIEQKKADDPRELRRRIAELEKAPKAAPLAPTVDARAVKAAVEKSLAERDAHWKVVLRQFVNGLEDARETLAQVVKAAGIHINKKDIRVGAYTASKTVAAVPPQRSDYVAAEAVRVTAEPTTVADGLSKREQNFLDAAAALQTLGTEVTRETVCGWVGVHPRGGSVGEVLKVLADGGYITNDRGTLSVTDKGLASANNVDSAAAIENAKKGLTNRQRDFFDLIAAAYPGSTTREQIAEAKGIHPRGGSLGEDLGRLVGRGLVESSRGQYRVRDFLFGNKG